MESQAHEGGVPAGQVVLDGVVDQTDQLAVTVHQNRDEQVALEGGKGGVREGGGDREGVREEEEGGIGRLTTLFHPVNVTLSKVYYSLLGNNVTISKQQSTDRNHNPINGQRKALVAPKAVAVDIRADLVDCGCSGSCHAVAA